MMCSFDSKEVLISLKSTKIICISSTIIIVLMMNSCPADFARTNKLEANELYNTLREIHQKTKSLSGKKVTLFFGTLHSTKSDLLDVVFKNGHEPRRKGHRVPRVVEKDKKTITFDYPIFLGNQEQPFGQKEMLCHNMIMKSARVVRFFFMVPFDKDINNFQNNVMILVKSSYAVIGNLKKMDQDSVGLIVSNIDFLIDYKGTREDTAVGKVIKRVGKNILSIYRTMEKMDWKSEGFKSQAHFDKAKEFLQLFTELRNKQFTKITVIGKPVNIIVGNEAINHFMDFINKFTFSRFEYQMEQITLNTISFMSRKLNSAVHSSVVEIGNETKKNFTIVNHKTMDLDEYYYSFINASNMFSNLIYENITTVEELMEEIVLIIRKLDIEVQKKKLFSLLDNKDIFVILKFLIEKSIGLPSVWLLGFVGLERHLNEFEKWIDFLKSIYTDLPLYIALNNISIQTIMENLYSKIKGDKPVKVSEIGLSKIIYGLNTKTNTTLRESYNSVKDMMVDKIKLWPLVRTLNDSAYNVTVTCPREFTIEIKGLVVKLEEIKKAVKNPCVKEVKHVEVFAYQSFIANNEVLNLSGQNISLAIIAKVWYVLGRVGIFLEGSDAPSYPETNDTKPGRNGKPGIPGNPGSNFFGFAERFSGLATQPVIIYTTGGRGGRGEDGAKGEDGEDGKFPKEFDETKYTKFAYNWSDNKTVRHRYFPDDDDKTVYNATFLDDNISWEVWGTKGRDGRKGGHGGACGKGGKPGAVVFIDLSQSCMLRNYSTDGTEGDPGLGASGGNGGKGGKRIIVACFYRPCKCKWFCEKEIDDLPGKNGNVGKDGITGNSTIGQAKLKDPDEHQPFASINRYKAVLRERMAECINKIELRQFIKIMEQSPKVIELYDHVALIEELKSLEEQYHMLHKRIDVLPFYESLSERIKMYFDEKGGDRDTKLALTSLFTATNSKVCSLKNNINSFMIIDVHHFLSKLIKDIRVLEEVGKEMMINKYVEDFTKEMDQQISGVDEMVNTELMPEINELMDGIKRSLDDTSAELKMMESKTEAAKQEVEVAREQAKKNIVGKAIMGAITSVFSVIAKVVSFIPGVGTAIGAAINVAVEGVKMIDSSKSAGCADSKQRALKATQSTIKDAQGRNLGADSGLREENRNILKSLIVGTNLAIKQMEENKDLTHFGKLYNEMKKACNEGNQMVNQKKVNIRDINRMRTNLKELVREQKTIIDDQLKSLKRQQHFFVNALIFKPNSSFGRKNHFPSLHSYMIPYALGNIKGLTSAKNVLGTFGTILSGTLNNIMDLVQHRNDMHEFNQLDKQLDDHLGKISDHQDEVHNVLLPHMEGLEDSIIGDIQDLSGKSTIELSASKDKILTGIDKTEKGVLSMAKGFDSEAQLKNLFKQLHGLIKGIVNIFEKVEQHNNLKKVARFQGDLQSARNAWDVEDRTLFALLNQLDFVMKASSLFIQYERAIRALKQYVFPFADYFLGEFASLPNMDLGGDFNSILFTIIPQIEKLFSNLDDWMKNINQHDTYIYQNIYFTDFNNQPFYTYSYSDYNASINRLLTGRSALITPDIREGLDLDAVKFNEIWIKLKLTDKRMQSELDDVLEKYDVSMTHHGMNTYRCGSKYYIIHSERLTLTYSFKNDKNGRPIRTNMVYDKISLNGYLLSPYASWSIKLIPADKDNFDPLQKFVNKSIDIILEGRGQYIRKSKILDEVCQGNLKNYYTEYKDTEIDEKIASFQMEEVFEY